MGAEDVHDAWVVWMEAMGRSHRSMIPFDRLDDRSRAADEPFVLAIHAAVSASE